MKNNLLLSPLILSISQIQFNVQKVDLLCFISFIVLMYSSYSLLPPPPTAGPTLAGKERVRRVGWFAPEFCLSFTASISHPGWWMKRTNGSGGWKCPHIGSQSGLKNKEPYLGDEKLKESNVCKNRASKKVF